MDARQVIKVIKPFIPVPQIRINLLTLEQRSSTSKADAPNLKAPMVAFFSPNNQVM